MAIYPLEVVLVTIDLSAKINLKIRKIVIISARKKLLVSVYL